MKRMACAREGQAHRSLGVRSGSDVAGCEHVGETHMLQRVFIDFNEAGSVGEGGGADAVGG